jgi:hypothetical protein
MNQPELARLIISNLGDLDAAAKHIQDDLQPAVDDAIDDILKTFRSVKNWTVERRLKSNQNDWLAPEDWRRKGDQAGNDYYCRFETASIVKQGRSECHFFLTQLLGIGGQKFGLRWTRNGVSRRLWAKAVGQQNEIIAALRSRGFLYEEKDGSFFLEIVISQHELADAFSDGSSELPLGPLKVGLETCFNAKSDFDALLKATMDLE